MPRDGKEAMASEHATPTNVDAEKCAPSIRSINNNNDSNSNDGDGGSSKKCDAGPDAAQEILALHEMDPVTRKKMHLVNDVSSNIHPRIPCYTLTLSFRPWMKSAGRDTTGNYLRSAVSGKYSLQSRPDVSVS